MSPAPVIGKIRVQSVFSAGGRETWTIVDAAGEILDLPDRYLRRYDGSRTQRTYAHALVGYLRWLAARGLFIETVEIGDLQHYIRSMGPGTEKLRVVSGPEKSPSTRATSATVIRGFHELLGRQGVNPDIVPDLVEVVASSSSDRGLLTHVQSNQVRNTLSPGGTKARRRQLPNGGADMTTAGALNCRDKAISQFFKDTGMRVGQLRGLFHEDLHLVWNHPCGDAKAPHLHIVKREHLWNGASTKVTWDWSRDPRAGYVTGGEVRLVSPDMIHCYFDYVTTDLVGIDSPYVFVTLNGRNRGLPMKDDNLRKQLRAAAKRGGVESDVRPHMFRHTWSNRLLALTKQNHPLVAKAGGWSSSVTVEKFYSERDLNDPGLLDALEELWGARE